MIANAGEGVERNPMKSLCPSPGVVEGTRWSIRYSTLRWLGYHVMSANSCWSPKTKASSSKLLTFPLSLNMICYVCFDERQKGSLEINIVLNLILLISQGDISG